MLARGGWFRLPRAPTAGVGPTLGYLDAGRFCTVATRPGGPLILTHGHPGSGMGLRADTTTGSLQPGKFGDSPSSPARPDARTRTPLFKSDLPVSSTTCFEEEFVTGPWVGGWTGGSMHDGLVPTGTAGTQSTSRKVRPNFPPLIQHRNEKSFQVV